MSTDRPRPASFEEGVIRRALRVLLRGFVVACVFLFYRMRVVGREHVPSEGGVLLTPNHMSFVDGLFLIASIKRPVRFIIDQGQYDRWYLKPFFKILGMIPISSRGGTRAILRSLRAAGERLDAGEVVCIFPEGEISRTGQMLPFRRGFQRIVRGRNVSVVPVHLDRVWGSIFSFAGGRFLKKVPRGIPYPVTVSFGEPLPTETPALEIRQAVRQLAQDAWYERKQDREPLHRSFIRAARHRPWRLACADPTRPRVSRLKALASAIALARNLRSSWREQQRIGILLPPSVGCAVANLAVSLSGRSSVNLNYTGGPAVMASAVHQAGLRSVLTSRAFREALPVELPEGLEVIELEDVVGRIGRGRRMGAALRALFAPKRSIERFCGAERSIAMDDEATIIFSSGSTSEPKGIVLSHFNLDSNIEAVSQVFPIHQEDRLLGVLPCFHSFGFMSMWLSLNNGMPIIFHANPLDPEMVGKLVHDYAITFLLGTPTFLQLYQRRVAPGQFGSLKVVLAGAERMPERVAVGFEERFGIRPLEGYGTTECSPVVATSIPSFRAPGFFQAGSRRGFVGVPLPGVAVRLVDPETGDDVDAYEPGMLLVRGPNVMKGYLDRPDLTEEVMRDGWYVTGDIAEMDEDGFIKITDRLSRFSKIGGEMIPHGAVEDALHVAYGNTDERMFVVTGIPDERKGERLAVLTVVDEDEVPDLLASLKEQGLSNLYVPRADAFVHVDAFPLLGTGKLDLRAVKRTAQEALDSAAA